METTLKQDLLIERIFPTVNDNALRKLAAAFVGTMVLATASQVSVPMFPVPMTLQTFAVFGLALMMGSRLATATVLLWLAEAAAGMPVLANASALNPASPSAGYLIGFIIAAYTVGRLGEMGWDKSKLRTMAAMFIGSALLYIPGVLYLGAVIGFDKPILALGLTPFIVGDLVKIAMATYLFPALWNRLSK